MRVAGYRDARMALPITQRCHQNEPPCGIFVAKRREIDDSPANKRCRP
jgi:hypothetical protein